jgi:hypothetical protein
VRLSSFSSAPARQAKVGTIPTSKIITGEPAAESERLAQRKRYQAKVDGVAHEAIGPVVTRPMPSSALGAKLHAGPSSARDLRTKAAPASARTHPDGARGCAIEASELPEKIRSEGKNKPKAERFTTTGARPPPS